MQARSGCKCNVCDLVWKRRYWIGWKEVQGGWEGVGVGVRLPKINEACMYVRCGLYVRMYRAVGGMQGTNQKRATIKGM